MKKDHCTWFPEKWVAWVSWCRWEIIDISPCCKIHDVTCSTSEFLRCLREKKVVGTSLVTAGGALGCWAKYTSKMFKRV